jgi:GT2 family glycosyltransferase
MLSLHRKPKIVANELLQSAQTPSIGVELHHPTASVVVCTYSRDRLEHLRDCLRSIELQTTQAHQIVLVVDHTRQLFTEAQAEFPAALVVENTRSRGCAGARNCGAMHANSDLLVFLDDDAMAAPEWLERLLLPFDSTVVCGTTGLVVPSWSANRPRWFPSEFNWVLGCSYLGLPTSTASVRNLWGTMAVRRTLFLELGGFNESIGRVGTLPLGCEDTEFSIRLRQRYPGADLLYVPSAEVAHIVEPERVRPQYFFRRCYAEGISKAAVTKSVGIRRALATERSYTARVLTAGLARGVYEAVRGDAAGAGRSFMILAGLVVTIAGFLRGTVARLRNGCVSGGSITVVPHASSSRRG